MHAEMVAIPSQQTRAVLLLDPRSLMTIRPRDGDVRVKVRERVHYAIGLFSSGRERVAP
jgi:hypothetical protein